MRLCDR
ncbi:hypothetical protein H632_c5403p0, partial [Helicosporidium sp. ATCC 50920]